MLQNLLMFFDPTKLTGREGFLNYKMSGFGSGKRSNNTGNSGGSSTIIIIIIIVLILLKACSD